MIHIDKATALSTAGGGDAPGRCAGAAKMLCCARNPLLLRPPHWGRGKAENQGTGGTGTWISTDD